MFSLLKFIKWSVLSHFRRGISKFYGGKSKSFTSLADASSVSSVKDLGKPENPYTRKRKNLLARANLLDKSLNYPLNNSGGGISKKLANSSRSSFLLGETLSSSGCNSNDDDSNLISTSPSSCLPPLHPHIKRSPGNRSSSPPERQSPCRSFSLSDLQCVAASTPNITGLAICSGDEGKKPHWDVLACVSISRTPSKNNIFDVEALQGSIPGWIQGYYIFLHCKL